MSGTIQLLSVSCFLVICASMVASQDCSSPLGIADGSVPDSSFGATTYQKWHFPYFARLNYHPTGKPGAWCSQENSGTVPRIWVHLGGEYRVTKIAIQGRNSSYSGMFTKKFKLYYQDKTTSTSFKQEPSTSPNGEFTGNSNKEDVVEHIVSFVASTVSILPTEFYPTKMACLRFELYGCAASQDECALGTASCDTNTTKCRNTADSYVCDCLNSGYKNDPSNRMQCIDVDECATNNGNCSQICQNTPGSYVCKCHPGFKLGNDQMQCTDINECNTNNGGCSHYCKNTPGSYVCSCNPGYHIGSDGKNCEDTNECNTNNGGCDHICINSIGSYSCKCNPGYLLDTDRKTCNDINECLDKNGGCNQTCNNIGGSYTCTCRKGYRAEGLNCVDIDECLTSPCHTTCINTVGSFICKCNIGFKLDVDGRNCKDIDECAMNTAKCPINSVCLNNIGSYSCPCKPGYKADSNGKCVSSSCPALQNIDNGFVTPTPRCLSPNSNVVNDICQYKCNTGYTLSSSSTKSSVCNTDGNWQFSSGSSPTCEPLRCTLVKAVAFGTILPATCISAGPKVNSKCQLFCDGGHRLLGASVAQCDINAQMSNDLSTSECVPDAHVKCPADVIVSLPVGAKVIAIKMPRFETNAVGQYVSTAPADVLSGTHNFKVGRTLVKITARNKAGHSADCTFAVDVIDREVPAVSNCTNANYYITIHGQDGTVSWPEPSFSDNVGVVKQLQNLQNNVVRPAQVYFVSYSAKDQQGNVATCKFFVHVRAKFCSKTRLPGGDGASVFATSDTATAMTVFLQCQAGKTLSFVIPGVYSYVCKLGDWTPSVLPDCVGFSTTTPCERGTRSVTVFGQTKCVNCPKGTQYKDATKSCDNCPLGYYQDQEKSFSCSQCPNGTTTVNTGAKEKLQCLAQCNPGTYSLDGLNLAGSCKPCPLGYYQESYGKNQCVTCPQDGTTLATGSKAVSECVVPATVTKVIPVEELAIADVGGTITIDCYASGIPTPFIYIRNDTILPPESFRGTVKRTPLTTSEKHTTGLRLQITNAQIGDNARFKCIADNRQTTSGARDERVIRVEINNNSI